MLDEVFNEIAFHILYLRWLWVTDQFAGELWMWFDLFYAMFITGKVLSYNSVLANAIKNRNKN